MMDEFDQIMTYIEDAVGLDANIKIGDCHDETLEDELRVTLIVTGFEVNYNIKGSDEKKIVSEIPSAHVDAAVSTPIAIVEAPSNVTINNGDVTMTRVDKTDVLPEKESFAFANFNPQPITPTVIADENKNLTYLNSNAKVAETFQVATNTQPENLIVTPSLDEIELQKRAQERASKLRGFNYDVTKPVEDIEDQINTPAYMRSKLQLDDEIHSSERISSNTALNTDKGDNGSLFNTNNSFFNPEVD
jgi:hypothetical protein